MSGLCMDAGFDMLRVRLESTQGCGRCEHQGMLSLQAARKWGITAVQKCAMVSWSQGHAADTVSTTQLGVLPIG